MTLVEILLVIFLPPVAVFMNRGPGVSLLLNIVLTLIGWIPGVLHAAWVASNSSAKPLRV